MTPGRTPWSRVAFLDESHHRLEDDRYGTVLAAVVIDEADEAVVSVMARSRLRPGQIRHHWRDESDRSRRDFIEAFAARSDVPLTVLVAATVVDRARRLERARVDNLWRLLAEFEALHVQRLVIESRQPWNDRHDRREIEHAKASGVCPLVLVYMHRRSLEDPVLWVSDAIAGSASAHLFREQSEYWDAWTAADKIMARML